MARPNFTVNTVREMPLESDEGDEGDNAGDREPRNPIVPAGSAHAVRELEDNAP